MLITEIHASIKQQPQTQTPPPLSPGLPSPGLRSRSASMRPRGASFRIPGREDRGCSPFGASLEAQVTLDRLSRGRHPRCRLEPHPAAYW